MTEQQLYKKLGMRIKELRTERNLSQVQLAVECDFEKSNLSRIEAGRTNPTIGTLFKISKGLGVSLMHLVDVSPK